ncbi:MAG: GNAT family N-acetyltransferase [Salinibacterium sp.]|nr:GNAT family N-acetyltransferase [Salinibacterium sp.]
MPTPSVTTLPSPPVAPTTNGFTSRHARLNDAAAIADLVNAWAARGLTLARTPGEVAESIQQFVVVEDEQGLAACGALVEWPPKVAEIRSVAVADHQQGKGAGRAVVSALVAKARDDGLETLVLLTKCPDFFAKQGFEIIDGSELPAHYVQAAIIDCGRTLEGRTAMRMKL